MREEKIASCETIHRVMPEVEKLMENMQSKVATARRSKRKSQTAINTEREKRDAALKMERLKEQHYASRQAIEYLLNR